MGKLKPLREFRGDADRLSLDEIHYRIKFFAEEIKPDMDVFLPTRGFNLQRENVWTLEQKQELIMSILLRRNIPRITVICTKLGQEDVYQIIDGKQRLTAMIEFYNNEFKLPIDGEEYYLNYLPQDYQNVIRHYLVPSFIAYAHNYGEITDKQKIDLFKFINFAGTDQDREHFKKLS